MVCLRHMLVVGVALLLAPMLARAEATERLPVHHQQRLHSE